MLYALEDQFWGFFIHSLSTYLWSAMMHQTALYYKHLLGVGSN